MVIIFGVFRGFSSCKGGAGSPTNSYALRRNASADTKSGKPYTWTNNHTAREYNTTSTTLHCDYTLMSRPKTASCVRHEGLGRWLLL